MDEKINDLTMEEDLKEKFEQFFLNYTRKKNLSEDAQAASRLVMWDSFITGARAHSVNVLNRFAPVIETMRNFASHR